MLIEKLKTEELSSLRLRPIGKRHFVRVAIEALDIGEALRVSREAFTWKRQTPRRFCNEISKKSTKRYEVSAEVDTKAWVVVRVG